MSKTAVVARRRAWWRRMAALAVVAFTVAACGTGGGGGGEGPIKIGLLQPLTGPVSAAGIAVRDGAMIALEEINADGGIDGRELELVVEDDENDPAVCTNAANKVITRDRVVGLIGGWGSSCTLAILPVVERHKVPLVVETSSSFKVTDPEEGGNDWTFRLSPPTRMEVAEVEGSLVDPLGFNKVFLLGVNNDWGRGSAADFTPAIQDAGGTVVGEQFFEQTEENFAPILTAVQGSGADSVVVTTDAAQIALILQQMRTLGLDLNVLTTGGSNFPGKVAELAGEEATEGTYFTVFFPGVYDPELAVATDRATSFVEKWRADHEFTEIGEAARGYDAVYTVAEAIRSVEGDLDSESLRDALASVQLDGIMYGDIQFEEWEGLINQNVPDVYIGQFTGGELQFVETADQ